MLVKIELTHLNLIRIDCGFSIRYNIKISKKGKIGIRVRLQPFLLRYIELEQMRYTDTFKVLYDVAENLLHPDHLIPPMLIQPYMENAVLHGLRNFRSGDGLLTIRGFINENFIILTVEDNGIGRQQASVLHINSFIKKNSLGMKVTQDRIAIFNNLVKGKKAKVFVEDCLRGTKEH